MNCFLSPSLRRYIEIKIIDDEEYEKNKNFHLQLGPPVILDIGIRHGKDGKMKKKEIPPIQFSLKPGEFRESPFESSSSVRCVAEGYAASYLTIPQAASFSSVAQGLSPRSVTTPISFPPSYPR